MGSPHLTSSWIFLFAEKHLLSDLCREGVWAVKTNYSFFVHLGCVYLPLLFHDHLAEYIFLVTFSFSTLRDIVLLSYGIRCCCWKDWGQFSEHIFVVNLSLSLFLPLSLSYTFYDFVFNVLYFHYAVSKWRFLFVYSVDNWYIPSIWGFIISHQFLAMSSLDIALPSVPQFPSSRSLSTCILESFNLFSKFPHYLKQLLNWGKISIQRNA